MSPKYNLSILSQGTSHRKSGAGGPGVTFDSCRRAPATVIRDRPGRFLTSVLTHPGDGESSLPRLLTRREPGPHSSGRLSCRADPRAPGCAPPANCAVSHDPRIIARSSRDTAQSTAGHPSGCGPRPRREPDPPGPVPAGGPIEISAVAPIVGAVVGPTHSSSGPAGSPVRPGRRPGRLSGGRRGRRSRDRRGRARARACASPRTSA